jgi:NitT/TauT family transport system permease protein
MIMELFHRRQALILGTLSMVGLVVLWQIAVDGGLINPFFISTPSQVWTEFLAQFADGEVAANLGATLYCFFWSMLLASIVGIVLGMLAGWFQDVESALEPFIWFKYSAPTVAFYPLFIAWLGYGRPTIIAIAFLFALTPIYANTLSGIKNIDRDLAKAARSFGARPLDIFLQIALPGSVPVMMAGLRLGVGRALTGVVVAELFGANAGLGYAITYYGQLMQTTKMMVPIVIVIVLGVILTQVLSFLESKTDSWRVDSGR